MKRQIKFLTIPLSLWEHTDLSVFEKHVLIDIDSVCSSPEGVAIGPQAIAGMCGLPTKTIKETLNSLHQKGAIEVNIDENGAKLLKPLLYRERYLKTEDKVVIGDSPQDIEQFNWEEIQQQWAKHCTMLPPIARWTPQRKRKLKSVLKSADLTIQDLYKCFRIIGCTPFLNGTSNDFKANFMWLISKAETVSKIYEGFYSRSYQEKRDYDIIMGNVADTSATSEHDDFYR